MLQQKAKSIWSKAMCQLVNLYFDFSNSKRYIIFFFWFIYLIFCCICVSKKTIFKLSNQMIGLTLFFLLRKINNKAIKSFIIDICWSHVTGVGGDIQTRNSDCVADQLFSMHENVSYHKHLNPWSKRALMIFVHRRPF